MGSQDLPAGIAVVVAGVAFGSALGVTELQHRVALQLGGYLQYEPSISSCRVTKAIRNSISATASGSVITYALPTMLCGLGANEAGPFRHTTTGCPLSLRFLKTASMCKQA